MSREEALGQHRPKTAEGRVLAFLLAPYAFAPFGYSTATIASFFVGRDRAAAQAQALAEATASEPTALRAELAALRVQLRSPRPHPETPSTAPLPRESVRKAGSSQLAL